MSVYVLSTSLVALAAKSAFSYSPMTNSKYTGSYGSIYVPASLLATYKTATNWTTYSNRLVGI